MWMLPMAIRARIAVIVLLGIVLIPVTTSSLRGLTHVLSCEASVVATLTIDTTAEAGGGAVLGSSDTVTRDPGGGDGGGIDELCGGLSVGLELANTTEDRAEVEVTLTNHTDSDWRGSVELRFAGADIPVSIGRVRAGTTESDLVSLRIRPGRSYEISGTLLLGP
jgi:hypothetical protein